MIKRLLPILLLASTYGLTELHNLFNDVHAHNWFIFVDRPMTDAWNVKYLTEEFNRIIEATFMFWIFSKFKVDVLYRLAALEYLLYRLIDLAFYPFWFKTYNYWLVFVVLGLIMAFVYLRKKKI